MVSLRNHKLKSSLWANVKGSKVRQSPVIEKSVKSKLKSFIEKSWEVHVIEMRLEKEAKSNFIFKIKSD